MARCKVCGKPWQCREDLWNPVYHWACTCEEPAGGDAICGRCDGIVDKKDPRLAPGYRAPDSDCSICTCEECRAKASEEKLTAKGETGPQPYIILVARRYRCPYCHEDSTKPFEGKCPSCKRTLAKEGREVEATDRDLIWR